VGAEVVADEATEEEGEEAASMAEAGEDMVAIEIVGKTSP
jgi:hypothetical protein